MLVLYLALYIAIVRVTSSIRRKQQEAVLLDKTQKLVVTSEKRKATNEVDFKRSIVMSSDDARGSMPSSPLNTDGFDELEQDIFNAHKSVSRQTQVHLEKTEKLDLSGNFNFQL